MWRFACSVLILTCAVFSGCRSETASDGQSMQYDFDRTTVGSLATGWTAAETNGQENPALWRIVKDGFAPSPPHVIAIVATKNTGSTYNLLMANSGTYRDLELSVHVRANSGAEAQGGGLFWRARDAQNYYMARWDPLAANLGIYLVKKGQCRELATTAIRVNPRRWHKITICHTGSRIAAALNDGSPLVVENKALQKTGRVGLWSRADAASSFDDLAVKGLDPVPDQH